MATALFLLLWRTAAGGLTPETGERPVRLAVISGDGDRAPKAGVVELLTAEVSKRADVIVLEREEIRKVLAEHGLSAAGLTEPVTAVKTGRLLAVDVFAVVDRLPDKSAPGLLRMQAIEARSGILLDSAFAEEKDAGTTIASLAEAVVAAAGKSRVPATERRYVCLLGVQSEEPGRTLDGLAQALHVLLGHDLHRARKVRLLDRERLDRLTAEKALSGIDLELKTSALFVDCSARRVAGKDALAFRVDLRPVAGGPSCSLDLEVAGQDVAKIRGELGSRILSALDVEAAERSPGSAEQEAAILLARTRHLIAHEVGLEAVRLAEAAYALAPSQESGVLLARACNDYAHSLCLKAPSADDKVRILAARIRERTVTLDLFREHAKLQEQGRAGRVGLPEVLGVGRLEVDARGDERVAALLREEALLDRTIAHFKIDYAKNVNGREPTYALANAVHDAARWADTAQDWAAEVRSLIERFEPPAGAKEDSLPRYHFCTIQALPGLDRFEGAGESAVVDGLWQWMIEQKDPLVVLVGYANKVRWVKANKSDTARAALTYFRDHMPIDHPDRYHFDEPVATIMGYIVRDGFADLKVRATCYVEVMRPILEAGEGQRMDRWLNVLNDWYRVIPRALSADEWRAWLERALAVYRSDPYLTGERVAPVVPKGDTRTRRSNNYLGPKLAACLAELGVKPALPEGFCSRFGCHELTCEPPGRQWALDWIEPRRDGCLVVWASDKDKDGTRSLSAVEYEWNGGRGKSLGQVLLPRTREQSPFVTGVATARGRTYVGCHAGLIVFDGGRAEIRDESRGLPAARVQALAPLGDWVYFSVVHRNPVETDCLAGSTLAKSAWEATYFVGTAVAAGSALCGLDPVSDEVVTFASSRSLRKRNPLDGEFLYSIESMLADDARRCVWLGVRTYDGKMMDPVGLWKFVPADGTVTQVCRTRSGGVTALRFHKGRIVAVTEPMGFHSIDPDTGAEVHLADAPDAPQGWRLTVSAGLLNLVEPGQQPVAVSSLPDGRDFPKVLSIRQIDEDRVLIVPDGSAGVREGRLWMMERKGN